MADKHPRIKSLGRSASTESTEYSITMGRSIRDRKKKPKERWLLTRKTWRYMADAGRKLIPDGAQNRLEDIPKIEAYFQEVCRKEPRFLLWRKNSYPGALGFRKKKKELRKGGSCRKATSADDVDIIKMERPKDLAIPSTSGGRFDINKMKHDFLNKPPSPTNYLPFIHQQNADNLSNKMSLQNTPVIEECDKEEKQLINMLEQYLTLAERSKVPINKDHTDFNYQELVDKLQRHLTLASKNVPQYSAGYSPRPGEVHFNGDHVKKSLSETLSRYFSQSTNRDKIISDLLTDRKTLERLYFDLRRAKGFRGSRGGTGYTKQFGTGNLGNFNSSGYHERERKFGTSHPPPLIEIESETLETTFQVNGTQTLPIPEIVLTKCDEDYRKSVAEKEEEEKSFAKPVPRRRSSVDHDDVSQSVSDTIKRYLRMARKKSVDSDKVDRFKRVNYDRNLRNIKAKGEITKPGDDDGSNKGCQTNDDWILSYRELKFDDFISDESRVSSSRSSIDAGVEEYKPSTSPTSPTSNKNQSFLSHLLHGKHDKHDKHEKYSSTADSAMAGAMQKSKSSSSVLHHGSRLKAKITFKNRSKSQTRPAQTPCSWTPQGGCLWNSITGRQVTLNDTTLLQLSEIERKVLQNIAISKLQAPNIGISVKVPTEQNGAAISKPKRRPYLLKRKAKTTSIFDASRKDGDKDKDSTSGLVFGIPLSQCLENDRLTRATATSRPYRGSDSGTEEPRLARHGSRASFSSLIETPRAEEGGSSESLSGRERIVGSVPGLLDTISYGSMIDIPGITGEEAYAVPSILTSCFRHIEQHGLQTLGIFRVSTSKKRIRQLREDFDSGKETVLTEEQCPHDVATLLKEYLRDLPDPLLCRDLYQAFVQTQRIRNRRGQFQALQHLIQLLPPANRDTLHALLNFLTTVSRHATDSTSNIGELVLGNKMDSNNLATVFAPNILHCIKPNSSKDTPDRAEDRIDIINVVRTLIDLHRELFSVSAELLDEVYVHMMDTYPDELDELLNKRDAVGGADESVEELDSESYSAPWTPTLPTSERNIDNINTDTEPNTPTDKKKTWSREEFLHETAATGGPNVGMRIRHKDRIRDKSFRRRREDSSARKKSGDEIAQSGTVSSMTSSISILPRLRGQRDDDYQYGKNRSSSMESTSSTHTDTDLNRILRISEGFDERRKSSPYLLDDSGVITASLTIPVQTSSQGIGYNLDDDIPYIEDADSGRQQLTIGVIKSPVVPPRRRQRSLSGSDSSGGSNLQPITGSISLVHGYDSAVGSSATTYSSPIRNTPTSMSSSIADVGILSSPNSWTSSPPTSPDSTNTSVNYIPDDNQVPNARTHKIVTKNSPTLQKVHFSSTQDIQQTRTREVRTRENSQKEIPKQPPPDVLKSLSTPSFDGRNVDREPGFTSSISNIGNAVLRSKQAEFERISKTDSRTKPSLVTVPASDKKKYTKRRYTDSRHQTRHIPDSEALDSVSTRTEDRSASKAGPVYCKRGEIISSVPSK